MLLLQSDRHDKPQAIVIPRKTFRNLPVKKQETIIRAAISEFADHGYKGASINTIVQKIGIAKGSIYQYFGDKEGLFMFVFSQAMDMVKEYLRDVRDTTENESLQTRLNETLASGVRFVRDYPVIYKLYGTILSDSTLPYRKEILSSLKNNSIDYICSLLEAAKLRGELNSETDILKACFILDAVMDKFLLSRSVEHADAGIGIFHADMDNVSGWISAIVEMICTGISCPSEIKGAR